MLTKSSLKPYTIANPTIYLFTSHEKIYPIKYFQKMQLISFKPDSITFVSILLVCATLTALEWGMDNHGKINRCGFISHVIVITTLINMYSKCESLKKASFLFDNICANKIISWNAMIVGYARNDYNKKSIKLFEQMKYVGINPNDVTFVSVLFPCSHASPMK